MAYLYFVALAVMSLPLAGWACPNCYGSSENSVLGTYYLSTAMLSLLPFGVVAGLFAVAWQLRRNLQQGRPGEEAALPRRGAS